MVSQVSGEPVPGPVFPDLDLAGTVARLAVEDTTPPGPGDILDAPPPDSARSGYGGLLLLTGPHRRQALGAQRVGTGG